MNSGYLKIYRKCRENFLYMEKPFDRWHAFEDLLFMARRFPADVMIKGKMIHLDVGQLIVGTDKLAERWGWSRGKVTRYMTTLETQGMIAKIGTASGTLITIENYGLYQLARTEDDTADGTADGTTDGTADGTHKKKEKKVRKKESKNVLITPHTPLLTDCGEELQEAVKRWLAYKQERGQTYKQVGLDTLIKKIKKSAIQYGESVVVDLIDECIANRYQGIIWERIQKQQPKEQDRLAWLDEIDWSGADDN